MPHYEIFNLSNALVSELNAQQLYSFPSSDGSLLLKVKQNDKYGVVDLNNNVIIEVKYDYISNLKNGKTKNYYFVELNGLVGFIDENGGEIIPVNYEKNNSLNEFKDGVVFVKNKGLLYLFNEEGEEVFRIKAESATAYTCDLSRASKNNFVGYFDKKGNDAIEFKFNYAYGFYNDGYAQVNYRGKWGFIDASGNFIVEPKFESFDVPSDCSFNSSIRIYTPRINKLYGIISPLLKKFDCECKYKKVKPLSEEFIMVKHDKHWGLINLNEEEILPYNFDDIKISLFNRLIFTKKGKKWAVSSFDNPLVPIDEVSEFYESNGVFFLKRKKNYYIKNNENEILIKTPIDQILEFKNERIIYKNDKICGVMNLEGDILLEYPCEHISQFVSRYEDDYISNLFLVKIDNKYGVINIDNQLMLDIIYDYIQYYGGIIIKKSENKYGFLNLNNNTNIDCKYDSLSIDKFNQEFYIFCSTNQLESSEVNYFIHINKDDNNNISIVLLTMNFNQTWYLVALAPAGGGMFGEICAKIENVDNWNISKGFFTTDFYNNEWEYFYNGELCDKINKNMDASDIAIFKKLVDELFEKYIEYADEEDEIPLLRKQFLDKLKKTSYISTTSTFYFKNLSKHWGIFYRW